MTANLTAPQLFEPYRELVWAYLARRGLPPHDIKDGLQQVLLKLTLKLQGQEEINDPRAYIFLIVRSVVVDWYRDRLPGGIALEELEGEFACAQGPGPEEEAEAAQLLQTVDALGRLESALIRLRFAGHTYKEIGRLLKRDPEKVRALVEDAMARLREKLREPHRPQNDRR
jgi:RNA polymerase sigma factor (sigma-70 family)